MNQEKDATKHYSRKISRMGNSLGVSLPKTLLRKIRHTKLPAHVRPEVLEAFYDVFEEDRELFDDLRDQHSVQKP